MSPTRRTLLKSAALLAGASILRAQATTKSVGTAILNIAYEESGPPTGFPVIFLHGFPDDAHAYDDVAPPLARAGYRVIVPYLRGYGATRFRDAATPRMAEQAAIGQDVIDLADALQFPRFAVGGYDWGGRAAAVAAALHPDRVSAAVLIGGYTIQDTISPPQPSMSPEAEERTWYQWYFNTERGRLGLEKNRQALCRYLWQTWSPTWKFSDETYHKSAASFENPDFVDCVIHSYRHRYQNAPGEPRFLAVERELAKRPKITCPVITLYGADDGFGRPAADATPAERALLPRLLAHRVVPGSGHFMPHEKPEAVSAAMLELLKNA